MLQQALVNLSLNEIADLSVNNVSNVNDQS